MRPDQEQETDYSLRYGRRLLSDLGCADDVLSQSSGRHPAVAWFESGLQSLTGRIEHPGHMYPLPLAASAEGALLAYKAIAQTSGHTVLGSLNGANVLTERAALMGLSRQGRQSAGGSCRLIDTVDGRLAVNLARTDDWAMLPAWLECEAQIIEGDWGAVEQQLAQRQSSALVQRARLMGLPVSIDALPDAQPGKWFTSQQLGQSKQGGKLPVVLDMSGLWAGPLCAHLLQQAGARVIKLESPQRPDGARQGDAAFYRLLNSDKECLALDLRSAAGRSQLKRLLSSVDIVIESSRPRAMQQLGIEVENLLGEHPGLTWLNISAYGRVGEQANWVGFGDDVAVAAGLSSIMESVTGEVMFCGDAIADPLTGLHAAVAALASYRQGGGRLLSLSMKDVTEYAAFYLPWDPSSLQQRHHEWSRQVQAESASMPKPRQVNGRAHALGEDTASILSEL